MPRPKAKAAPSQIGHLIVFAGEDALRSVKLAEATSELLKGRGVAHKLIPVSDRAVLTADFHGNWSGALSSFNLSPAATKVLHFAFRIDLVDQVVLPALDAGVHVIVSDTLLDSIENSPWTPVIEAVSKVESRLWRTRPTLLFKVGGCRSAKQEPNSAATHATEKRVKRAKKSEGCGATVDLADGANWDAAIKLIVRTLASHNVVKQRAPRTRADRWTSDQLMIPLQFDRSSESQIPPPVPTAVISRTTRIKPTIVFDTYWRFASERQKIFFRRFEGRAGPWTSDRILTAHKFTNAYRASDRVSQFLIKHVIYRPDLPQSASEICFRILLFKLFNKIETWRLLEGQLGAVLYEDYSFRRYDQILSRALRAGERIYSAAYIMPPGSRAFGETSKHQNHLRLLELMMRSDLPLRLSETKRMEQAFELLRSFPTIGNFLAYQLITDINYSTITDFSEMEFVMPGPGALDGIRKCFAGLGDLSEPDVIRWMAERQTEEFERLGLNFQSLFGRPLQLIDCQNLFCEVDKYSRVAHPEFIGLTGRSRIKQKFVPTLEPIGFWYPPKWRLNAPATSPRHSESISSGTYI